MTTLTEHSLDSPTVDTDYAPTSSAAGAASFDINTDVDADSTDSINPTPRGVPLVLSSASTTSSNSILSLISSMTHTISGAPRIDLVLKNASTTKGSRATARTPPLPLELPPLSHPRSIFLSGRAPEMEGEFFKMG